MKKIIAIVLVALCVFALASCGAGNSLVGVWVPEGTVDEEYNYGYIFNKDGTFNCVVLENGKPTDNGIFTEYANVGMPIKWKASGDTITISIKILVDIEIVKYAYSMDGNVLILDGQRMVKYAG